MTREERAGSCERDPPPASLQKRLTDDLFQARTCLLTADCAMPSCFAAGLKPPDRATASNAAIARRRPGRSLRFISLYIS